VKKEPKSGVKTAIHIELGNKKKEWGKKKAGKTFSVGELKQRERTEEVINDEKRRGKTWK